MALRAPLVIAILFISSMAIQLITIASAAAPQFKREEMLILNLNRGPNSAGYFIANSIKETHSLVKDLDRALRQVEQADRAYAKTKGRPDDHYLESGDLKEALATATLLEKQLRQANDELKSSIQQALIAY